MDSCTLFSVLLVAVVVIGLLVVLVVSFSHRAIHHQVHVAALRIAPRAILLCTLASKCVRTAGSISWELTDDSSECESPVWRFATFKTKGIWTRRRPAVWPSSLNAQAVAPQAA